MSRFNRIMKSPKNPIVPPTSNIGILDDMAELEKEFEQKREAKKTDLETVRQDLIAKLRKVDEYLETNSFGGPVAGKETGAKRMPKGELERYIREALAKGPAPIGDLLKRIREAGLTNKDGSIRSKVGNPKWIQANGIVKNGNAFALKK